MRLFKLNILYFFKCCNVITIYYTKYCCKLLPENTFWLCPTNKKEKGFPCVINAYCRGKNCKCGEFTHLFIYMQGGNGVSYPFLLVQTRHSCRRCKIRSYIGESSRTSPRLMLSPEHRPSLLLLKQTNYQCFHVFI